MEFLFKAMQEVSNKKITVSHEYLLSRGCFPVSDLAEKYGYAKDHIGWLARTGRIQAVRYGKHGKWYANEKSLIDYQDLLADKPANKLAADFVTSKTNYVPPKSELQALNKSRTKQDTEQVRGFVRDKTKSPSSFLAPLRNERSYSAKSFDKAQDKFASSRVGEIRRTNAIPMKFLLLVGGILFLSIYFRPFINDFAPQMARVAMGERTYAGIVDSFRNIFRLFIDDYSAQTYVLVDPFKLREREIKE